MKKVYVAGAMSADNILDMLNNISKGIKLGSQLLEKGYAPFVPHFDIFFKIQNGVDYNVPMEFYYNYTMEWLKASDCVVVCDGWENSKGTKAEIEMATKLNIPVYFSINELLIADKNITVILSDKVDTEIMKNITKNIELNADGILKKGEEEATETFRQIFNLKENDIQIKIGTQNK